MEHTFNVQGMTCGHCERAVQQAVRAVDPQADIHIDRATNTVVVRSSQPQTLLADAIREEGYTVA